LRELHRERSSAQTGSSFNCPYCCFMMRQAENGRPWDTWTESLYQSYQNVGDDSPDDERWLRAIKKPKTFRSLGGWLPNPRRMFIAGFIDWPDLTRSLLPLWNCYW
jgi:hypothetical protein